MTITVAPPPADDRTVRRVRPVPGRATSAPPVADRSSRPDSQSRRREAIVVAAQGLTLFGLIMLGFVVYLIGISSLEQGRAQRSLRTALHRDLTFGNAWIGGQIPEGAAIAQLVIPRVGVSQIVVEGTAGGQLKKGPGHLRTSPLPGQPGNVVIAGRRLAYGGPFRHLDQLRRGDQITLTTGQGRARYEVTGVTEISRRARDVIDNFGDDRLTLISSAPILSAERRLVATAVLQTAVQPVRAARPTDIRKDELGLQSDRSTAYALLLWAQALLLASLGTAWLRRRWRRWPSYLVAAPVLMLLILLVFDSFTPVLPATL